MPGEILRIALLLAPMYAANSTAMLLGGKTPLDFGMKFMGKQLFGNGKTWKGTFFGILGGTIAALIISLAFPGSNILFGANYVDFGFLLSSGAVIGDIAGSFVKRRLGIGSGQPAPLLDQTDFVFGALAFASLIYLPQLIELVAMLIVTIIAHRLVNVIAFKLKIKKVPW